MRILFISRNFGTLFGGGEAFDLSAAEALAAGGHDIHILGAIPFFGKSDVSSPLNITYLRFPNLRKVAYSPERFTPLVARAGYHLDLHLFQAAALRWVLSQNPAKPFDVIQCCSLFPLCEKLLQRTTAGVIGWLPGNPSPSAQRILRRLLQSPRFALFTHGAALDFLSSQMGLREDRDYFDIPPGVLSPPQLPPRSEALSFRREHGIPEDATVGVTVARLIPIKNIALLIDAVRIANQKTPLHWLLCGGGAQEENLRRKAVAAGLQDKVHFLGQQPPQQVRRVLTASDFFALSSDYDSCPLALLEAMAYALPIAVRPLAYPPTMVRRSNGGMIARGEDAQAFSEALLKLATQPDLRAALGQNARAFVQEQTWERTASQLLGLYQKTGVTI